MVPSFVLGSRRSSPYPRGYASGPPSPAALLENHFEHPTIKGYLKDNGLNGSPSFFLQPKPELKRLHSFRLSAIGEWMVTANKNKVAIRDSSPLIGQASFGRAIRTSSASYWKICSLRRPRTLRNRIYFGLPVSMPRKVGTCGPEIYAFLAPYAGR